MKKWEWQNKNITNYFTDNSIIKIIKILPFTKKSISHRKNVGYASTSNSAGLAIGMFIGSVCFTLLVSEQFSNKYFRMKPDVGGLITMKST